MKPTMLLSLLSFLVLLAAPAALVGQELELGGGVRPLAQGGSYSGGIELPPDLGVGYSHPFAGGRVVTGFVWTPTNFRRGRSGETWRVHRVQLTALYRARGGELYVEGGPAMNWWTGFNTAQFGDGPVGKLSAVLGAGVHVGYFELGLRAMAWRESFTALRELACSPGRCNPRVAYTLGARAAFVRHKDCKK